MFTVWRCLPWRVWLWRLYGLRRVWINRIYFYCEFTGDFLLGIAGLAPLASHSLSTATKSNQKRPPRQLRPVKNTGFPSNRGGYHAAPELAKNAQTCWYREPMITTPVKWLAKVDCESKSKAKNSCHCMTINVDINAV